MKGFELVVEGPDGAGKTTLVKSLIERISPTKDIICARHPGATPLGAELRTIIKNRKDITFDRFTEQVLMAADRTDYIEQVLKPAINTGKIVISDRSNFISGMCYGYAGGLTWNQIRTIHNIVIGAKPPKSHLMLLIAPYTVLQTRRHPDIKVVDGKEVVQECKIESRGDVFHKNVNNMYTMLSGLNSLKPPFRCISDDNTTLSDLPEHDYVTALQCSMHMTLSRIIYTQKKDGLPLSIWLIDATLSAEKVLEQALEAFEQIYQLELNSQLL